MYANAKTLLLGIGGFGANILKYLQENRESFILPSHYNTLVLCNDTHPKKEIFLDFCTMFEEYKRIIIFAGVGGTYASDILQTILKQEKLEIEKFYIVVVAPFSFEGKARALLAQKTLDILIASKIGYGIFANSETMDKINGNVRKAMEGFNKKIIESIP